MATNEDMEKPRALRILEKDVLGKGGYGFVCMGELKGPTGSPVSYSLTFQQKWLPTCTVHFLHTVLMMYMYMYVYNCTCTCRVDLIIFLSYSSTK